MKRRRWLGALGALALGVVLLLLLWRHDHAEHQERGPTPGAPSRAEGSGEAGPQRERASGWDAGAATAARRPTAPIRLSSARAAPAATSSGVLEGRVVGWASARPIAGAELTFASDRGATSVAASVRSDSQGNFRFEPASPGAYHLALAVAEGFLPFAPDLGASPIHFEARPGARVEGAQVFLVDAVRYEGRVVDASERPVASCPVRLLGGPRIEQSLLPLPDRYVTDDQGRFDFVAPDESVFEAVHPSLGRGRASVDSAVQVSHRLTIRLGGGEGLDGSQSIAGLVVDEQGRPIEDARVRASFLATAGASDHELHPLLEARSDASGRFTIAGADRGDYRVGASAGGYASAVIAHVSAGARDLRLVLGSQSILRARGTDSTGAPIAAPSVIVERALGPLAREAVDVVSGYDAEGWVEVHGLAAGSYEVTLAAAGFAPASSSQVILRAGETTRVELTLGRGAALAGVVTSEGGGPLEGARVTLEGRLGEGASAVPVQASALTDGAGRFELSGVSPGMCSIVARASDHHGRVRSGIVATEGARVDVGTIELAPVEEGEEPALELAGIGAVLSAEGDAMVIGRVIEGGGAAEAGLVAGDAILEVEGVPVTTLGFGGTIERIRGPEGTQVSLRVRRASGAIEPIAVPRRRIRA